MDRAFLIVLSMVTGLRFFGGPFGLPGFCKAINSPELILRDSCSSKTLFKTFAMLPCNVGVPYFEKLSTNFVFAWGSVILKTF